MTESNGSNGPIELCSICLLELNNEIHTLECNHSFHMKCIMKWFRYESSSGNCPLCNDNPFHENSDISPNSYFYSNFFIDERIKHLKKWGRKKDCPIVLKKELTKLLDYEKRCKVYIQTRTAYLKQPEIKEYRACIRKTDSKVWNQRSKIYRQKNKIVALFPTIQMI